MRTRLLRGLSVLLVLSLLAAGCGDDDTQDTSADTTAPDDADPGGGEPDDADVEPAQGVTEDSIAIGALGSDLDALRELGLTDINVGDANLVWQTLVDELNDRGGIDGRTVELNFRLYNPVNAESADKACTELTVDREVFAVLGGIGGPVRERITCFIDVNETVVVGGSHTPTLLEQAKVPWVSDSMSAERRHRATIELYDDMGLFDGKTVGIFDDSSEVDITEQIVIPALEEIGVTDPVHVTSNVASDDEVALAQQTAVFAQTLQDEGVDLLLIVQSQISLGFGLIRQEGYDGEVATIDSGTALNGLGGLDERDPETFEGGISPMGLTNDEIWEDELAQECLQIFTDANPDIEVLKPEDVTPGEPNWFGTIVGACRLLRLFERIMSGVEGVPTYEKFEAAAESTGTFALPGQPFNSGSSGKLDMDDGLRLGEFDSSIPPEGALVPLTDFENIG